MNAVFALLRHRKFEVIQSVSNGAESSLYRGLGEIYISVKLLDWKETNSCV